MGRFSKIDFEEQPLPISPEDTWPDLDEHACMRAGHEKFERGQYENALVCYSRALRFNRDLTAAWVGQIRCLICLGEYAEAVTWSDRALERFADTPDLLACKGLAGTLQGDAAAQRYLDDAVALRTPSPWVWLARGEGLLVHHSLENAHRCFLKAMELESGEWRWELRVGMAYNRANMPARARGPLMSAVRSAGENPLVLYHLALMHEGLGDFRLAVGFYERTLAAQRDFTPAKAGLRRVSNMSPVSRWWRQMQAAKKE